MMSANALLESRTTHIRNLRWMCSGELLVKTTFSRCSTIFFASSVFASYKLKRCESTRLKKPSASEQEQWFSTQSGQRFALTTIGSLAQAVYCIHNLSKYVASSFKILFKRFLTLFCLQRIIVGLPEGFACAFRT